MKIWVEIKVICSIGHLHDDPPPFCSMTSTKTNTIIPLENYVLQTCTKLMYTLNDEESLFKQRKNK